MIVLVFLGLLLVFFAFGKGLIDLIVLPARTIDLAADDQIEAGFLPVYAEEGEVADSELVSVELPPAQPFPTPQAQPQNAVPTADPGEAPERLYLKAPGCLQNCKAERIIRLVLAILQASGIMLEIRFA